MIMQNKALICALEALINSQYASNIHAKNHAGPCVLPFFSKL